ncbi:MAG: ATP-dependent DNA helicase RecQ [Methylotenera sp.]|nr:ATP-dependent DNA helicase RecQ [Oligoflexia bacterium]
MLPSESPSILRSILKSTFGFDSFRPYQEEVCEAAVSGKDLLLVMPTGAGKSLCYQLPGLARPGTTLVISPLIALMEDQAIRLQKLGLKAERIHAGRDRAASRQVCIDYLSGRLDFLFIAPERLAVPGFIEMLAKRKPSLIAIDEAHCISQWGHDFRPEYRMLGQRLPMLRPAPVIALTATATAKVQDDIVTQLGLGEGLRFIHGFRRSNIGIEVVELNPSERAPAVLELLKNPAHLPAIVYAPTRKEAEDLATQLKKIGPCSAYHAGLTPESRETIQASFLDGKLNMIVATIAFGMGIDKSDVRMVIHTALPASVEGYYQEIGRAGRDGKNSRAVLMHAYVDRRTHEWFHTRDYPEPVTLKRIYAELSQGSALVADPLRARLKIEPDVFEKALMKMRVHGAVTTDMQGDLMRGTNPDWIKSYTSQRDHKLAQLSLIAKYAESSGCRMLHLVNHFGDQTDSAATCGLCDVCAPELSVLQLHREANPQEQKSILRILSVLNHFDTQDGMGTGRLFTEAFAENPRVKRVDPPVERKEYEHLLRGLARAEMITLKEDAFEKDGKCITYQRAALTAAGRKAVKAEQGSITLAFPKKGATPVRKRRKSAKGGGKTKKTSTVKSSFFR